MSRCMVSSATLHATVVSVLVNCMADLIIIIICTVKNFKEKTIHSIN